MDIPVLLLDQNASQLHRDGWMDQSAVIRPHEIGSCTDSFPLQQMDLLNSCDLIMIPNDGSVSSFVSVDDTLHNAGEDLINVSYVTKMRIQETVMCQF